MRNLTIYSLLLLSVLSINAKDIWYKTDFPEDEQVVQFAPFGDYAITLDKIYKWDRLLHWSLIRRFENDTILNSVNFDNYQSKIIIGTNHGVYFIDSDSISKIETHPFDDVEIDILGSINFNNGDHGFYFNTPDNGNIGLFYKSLTTGEIDNVTIFAGIKITKFNSRSYYPNLITDKNLIYTDFNTNAHPDSCDKFITGKLQDFVERYSGPYATTNGLFDNHQPKNYLPGINCLEIAVEDFYFTPDVYDPDQMDEHLSDFAAYIATEHHGVYKFPYSDRIVEQINSGLTDTNTTHITMSFDLRLIVSTQSKGVFVTEKSYNPPGNVSTTNEMAISPNPVNSNIIIKSNGLSLISSVQIYDIFGSMVLETNGNQSAELSLDLSALPAGTYYCKAVIGGKLVVKKIMKI